jgi:hypothetical protein
LFFIKISLKTIVYMGNKAVCITHETTRKCGNKVARDRCVFIARCQSSGHFAGDPVGASEELEGNAVIQDKPRYR